MTANITKIRLKKFDMSKVGNNKVVVFIGKRNSGKSCLVLDYLSHNLELPVGMVISPTDAYNKTFKDKVPDMLIHSQPSAELLEAFLTRQKRISERALIDPSIDPRAFLILDDCLSEKQLWINDHTIKFLFYNGRHVNTTLIITLQSPLGIPPTFRDQIDYVFICKDTSKQNRMKLYDAYAGMFPSKQAFEDTMLQACDNYAALAIYKSSQSYKLEDQVFWYKANMERIKNFKVCHPMYWKANEDFKQKRQQQDIDREKEEILKSQGRRSGSYTVVRKLEQNVEKIV